MRKLLPVFPVLLFFGISGCIKPSGGRCEEPIDAERSSEVVITFKEKATGKYLYSEVNPLYNKDSLRVYDPNGESLIILSTSGTIPNTYSGYYIYSFGPLYDAQTDKAALTTEVCKKYIIKYNSSETDTVTTCFRLQKTECGSVFSPLKIYHEGQLLDSATGDSGANITLLK